MRDASPSLVQRAAYTAPAFFVRTIDLVFDLDAAKTLVTSRMRIERNAAVPRQPLRLDGDGLTLLRVLLDGASVSFRHDGDTLVIDEPPAADGFVLELRTACAPAKNTALSGLYVTAGGLCTQCEAEGFRRITFFPDRPDVMAVYTVTLRGDRARLPVLLSNGNLVEHGALDGGRHFATWHDPFPKPSYLFALVAGTLVAHERRVVARSGSEHLLQVYVRPGDLGRTAHAMDSLVASLAWDEARYGLSLDLERFMVVAVPDFNGGAMENKGLNIFNTKYVLADAASATDADFAAIESVVAHEYFHNWTGNRITCRDWFQLSLKEGLTVFRDQQFSADMAGGQAAGDGSAAEASARAVRRIDDVRRLRQSQFPEDAGPMAHPVRPDSYLEINNFYTATVYEKGAEVVRMMHTLVGGDEGFRRGMRLYFERHDGQAVTCDDFAQAIADANPGSELATRLEPFKRWYAQAGTPRVAARGAWDAEARRYTLTLTQHNPPSPGQPVKQPQVVPVRAALLAADDGAPLTAERLLVLDQAEQHYVFDGVDRAPVPSLLRGFSAPVWLDDGLDDGQRLRLLAHDSDPFNRWEAGQKAMLARLLAALREDRAPVLDAPLADALRRVLLDASLAPAYRDLVLAVPTESYLAEQVAVVDPLRIHRVREQFRAQLAAALADAWQTLWPAPAPAGGWRPTPQQAGARALANHALTMGCIAARGGGDARWPERALRQCREAGNMTDRVGALAALLDSQSPLADAALVHFHARAGGAALVLDKWFALQATAGEPVDGLGAAAAPGSSFERARALLAHPDFVLANPNRARSLLFALCGANPGAFHRADGAGYDLWAEQLLRLDAINGQIAGRFARTMDRWAVLAEPYRAQAHAAIERVASAPTLSTDVREVLARALEETR